MKLVERTPMENIDYLRGQIAELLEERRKEDGLDRAGFNILIDTLRFSVELKLRDYWESKGITYGADMEH